MKKKHDVDKNSALELVEKDAYILEDLPEEFKGDYDVVKLAVSLKPYSFGSANETLRNNAELAIMAIKGNPNTVRYVGEQLMKNRVFLKDAYTLNNNIINLITDDEIKKLLQGQ